MDAEANGSLLSVLAPVTLDIFECARTGQTTWERGELKATEPIAVRADLSAALIGECVVFGISDLRAASGTEVQSQAVNERIEMVRALALDAVDLLLDLPQYIEEFSSFASERQKKLKPLIAEILRIN